LYRGVAFDFADTLAELSPSRESLIVDLCRDHAKTVLSEQRVALAYRLLDSLNPYSSVTIRSATAKRAFYLQYNQKLLTLLGMSHLIGPEQVYDGFASKTPHWRLKQGVQSMLARLSQSNLSLALLSNFDTKLYDVLARLGIDHYFQQICVSQELGVEKPLAQVLRADDQQARRSAQRVLLLRRQLHPGFPSRHLVWTFRLPS
jgi:FMN phosphatase YigB (HAD superfamily)